MPRDLVPRLYELELKPYIGTEDLYGKNAFTFDGRIHINFECKTKTKKIIFHMKDLILNASSFRISSTNDSDLDINREWTYDEKREYFQGTFTRECKQNVTYTLFLAYKGFINDKLSGFYRSSYFDPNLNQSF